LPIVIIKHQVSSTLMTLLQFICKYELIYIRPILNTNIDLSALILL